MVQVNDDDEVLFKDEELDNKDESEQKKKKEDKEDKNDHKGNTAREIIILILIVIIILLLFWRCGADKKIGGNLIVDSNITTQKIEEEVRQIYFIGLDNMELSKNDFIYLTNPEENLDFYFMFNVYDAATGKSYFESDLVPPGKSVKWTPGETMSEGTYNVVVGQTPYHKGDSKEFEQLAKGGNQVVITIK